MSNIENVQPSGLRRVDYRNWLASQLGQLATQKQVAFGCCCCERLYPGYKAHVDSCGMADDLRKVIDGLWRHLLGDLLSDAEISRMVEKCRTLELREGDEHWNSAIDAVDATWLTLQACQSDTSQNIAKAAEYCLTRVDRAVENEILGPGSCVLTPAATGELLEKMSQHPRCRAELRAQESQLYFLATHGVHSREDIQELLHVGGPGGIVETEKGPSLILRKIDFTDIAALRAAGVVCFDPREKKTEEKKRESDG